MSAPEDSTKQNEPASAERRHTDRTREDADWESKVIGRLGGRLKNLPTGEAEGQASGGWESSVLDTLRRRIERGPT